MAAMAACAVWLQPVQALDFDAGSAPKEVIIPGLIPVVFETVAPSDATLVLRTTTLITNSWFDAIAPYGDSSVGVYSRLDRRPVSERTDANRNIAILYSSHKVLMSLYPEYQDIWDGMLSGVGLDPADSSTDPTTAVGIGNLAGLGVVEARENDGMNQLGNEDNLGKDGPFRRVPYADYTGFRPVNSAYELIDPSKWQPAVTTTGYGIFKVQQYVTPQFALTDPYSYDHPRRFRSKPPLSSNFRKRKAYKAQADEVLAASAAMTDEQKMLAELFDNKINSLGFSALFRSTTANLSLEQFVWYDFLTNIASFDTGIAVWQEKTRFNAVRPFSAIAYLYEGREVTAWGGPYQGTVNDLPGEEWQSYLPVADHPEYPSGSASFCSAHATSSRLFFGTDQLGWSFPVPQGSSVIEPGHTPQSELVISFPTWTDFEETCGMTRFWAGVHFKASIPAGQAIGREVGALAYEFLMDHIEGTADEPGAGDPTPPGHGGGEPPHGPGRGHEIGRGKGHDRH